MITINPYTRRARSVHCVLGLAALALITTSACTEDPPELFPEFGTGGSVLSTTGGMGSTVNGAGGVAVTSGGGSSTGGWGGTIDGDDFPYGGAAGGSGVDFEWLDSQGARCEATSTAPTPLPSEPSLECALFEIGLPGVVEYTIDPSSFDLDRDGQGGVYKYLGCDHLDAPCMGRLEYSWEAEYLADNEWHVSVSPVHAACDYDHFLLHELPTGKVASRGTLTWQPIELTLHLQPTLAGLTVGAVRSSSDGAIETGAFTEMQYNGGWPEDELRGLFDAAFVEHLKSLEWQCDQP